MLQEGKKNNIQYLINQIGGNKGLNIPKCCLFIGAGCSKTSDIPLGSELIELCKKLSYAKKYLESYYSIDKVIQENNELDERIQKYISSNKSFFDSYVKEQEDFFKRSHELNRTELASKIPENLRNQIKDEMVLWETYKEKIFYDNLYGNWLKIYSENPKDRQKLIELIIENKEPSGAYAVLAYLIEGKNRFKNLFTTNFDDLINDALRNYLNTKAKVFSHNEIAKYIDVFGNRPNIIKLHGDFLFETIKNTSDETCSLGGEYEEKLFGALSQFDLVVIGYNGADNSIMNALYNIKREQLKKGGHNFGLYWCGTDEEKLNWKVANLINTTSNSYFIKIDSFESVITKLWYSFGGDKIQDTVKEKASERARILQEHLSNYSADVDKDSSIEKEVKEKVKTVLAPIKDELYLIVHSLPNDEKKKYFLERRPFDAVARVIKNISSDIDRAEAERLFSILDDGKFFQEKIKRASIQYISNAFCNLKEIDSYRTIALYKSVEDKIYKEKFVRATAGEIYSAIGELNKIDPTKTKSISVDIDIPRVSDFDKITFRQFSMQFSKLNPNKSFDAYEGYSDEIILKKIKNESLYDIATGFEKLYVISRNKTKRLYNSIDDIVIIEKIKQNDNITLIVESLSRLGKINNEKTSLIIKSIGKNIFEEKIKLSTFHNIASGLILLGNLNTRYSRDIYLSLSEEFFIEKCNQENFNAIAHGFSKLTKINSAKSNAIFNRLLDSILIEKLNAEQPNYGDVGTAIINLYNLYPTRTKKIVVSSNLVLRSKELATSAMKLGAQAFLHYVTFFVDVDLKLACGIIQNTNKNYLLDLYGWSGLELYTSKLPKLLLVYDNLRWANEAKTLTGFIYDNIHYLQEKCSEGELNNYKKLMQQYREEKDLVK